MDLNRFYVYVHKDMNGNIFYVGKGTRDRAWKSKDRARHHVWHRYIKKLNGKYEIEIVKEGLEEEKALALEEELIEK